MLALARNTFLSVLGPLEALMTREKSPQVRDRVLIMLDAEQCSQILCVLARTHTTSSSLVDALAAAVCPQQSVACCKLPAHGPLQVIAQRLSKLGTFKKSGAPERQPAEVLIKRKKRGRNGDMSWEIVRARGHLDEVLEMRKGGTKLGK